MTTEAVYGKPDIAALMEHMKTVNKGMLDGSIKMNRNHCSTMLKRIANWFPGEEPQQLLRHLIDIAKADPFHGPKTTSFAYLIYKGATIIQEAQAKKNKGHGNREESARTAADALARKLADRQG